MHECNENLKKKWFLNANALVFDFMVKRDPSYSGEMLLCAVLLLQRIKGNVCFTVTYYSKQSVSCDWTWCNHASQGHSFHPITRYCIQTHDTCITRLHYFHLRSEDRFSTPCALLYRNSGSLANENNNERVILFFFVLTIILLPETYQD